MGNFILNVVTRVPGEEVQPLAQVLGRSGAGAVGGGPGGARRARVAVHDSGDDGGQHWQNGPMGLFFGFLLGLSCTSLHFPLVE